VDVELRLTLKFLSRLVFKVIHTWVWVLPGEKMCDKEMAPRGGMFLLHDCTEKEFGEFDEKQWH